MQKKRYRTKKKLDSLVGRLKNKNKNKPSISRAIFFLKIIILTVNENSLLIAEQKARAKEFQRPTSKRIQRMQHQLKSKLKLDRNRN